MTVANETTDVVVSQSFRSSMVLVNDLIPNPWQPRQHFNEVELIKLAENIRLNGLINPVTVRLNPEGAGYQIAAGERRWRAYKLLLGGYDLTGPAVEDAEGDMVPGAADIETQGNFPVGVTLKAPPDTQFARIPVTIRPLDDAEMIRLALGENGQRTDITAMEEAEAYSKMLEHLHITQTEFGKRMGLSQSHVANRLRMLKLPESLRHNWILGELTQWHAIKLLEWQAKYNLTLPYLAFLTIQLKKNRITTSYLDDGPFEDKIASLPGGRELLQNNPLPIQANMLDEIEEEAAPAPLFSPQLSTEPSQEWKDSFSGGKNLMEEADKELVTPPTPSLAPAQQAAPVPISAPVAGVAPAAEPAQPTTLASATQAQPNIEQAKKDAASQKFAEKYSNKFLLGQPPAPLDRPTCRLLARMVVINTYLRMANPAAFVVKMQGWLRQHNLNDELAQFYPSPLPVVWIDRQLEEFGEEFYRNPEVVQAAVAMTTECALATGDFNNSLYQAELYTYIRAALAEAAKKAENEIPEFK